MAKTTKTEVAKVKAKSTEMAVLEDEFAQDAEDHKETLGKGDISIPFLQILQSLSPQCTRGEAEFIKGAEASDLFDTVTQKLYKTRNDDDEPIPADIKFLPIFYKASVIEWVPRSKGGGFVAEHPPGADAEAKTVRNENGQLIIQTGSPIGTPGNQLVETHTHFVFLIHPDGTYEPSIISMSSTQLKSSRDLNSMVQKHKLPDGRGAPRFYGIYSATTQFKSNEKGSWYVWKFEKVDDVQTAGAIEMYRAAKDFLEGVKTGEHQADHGKHGESAAAGENGEVDNSADDEIPM